MSFVHLQIQSAYSFLEGPCRIEDLVNAAADKGYTSLALTDANNLYGVHAFAEACADRGLRPIFGMELRGSPPENTRAVLLARTGAGFSNLCRLATRLKSDQPFHAAADLPGHAEGLIVMTACPALLQAWKGKVEDLHAQIFPWDSSALYWSDRLKVPLVASLDAAFLEPGDREIQRVLRAIGKSCTLAAVGEEDLKHPQALLLGPEEAGRAFAAWPEALEATQRIASRVEFDRIGRGWIFPDWQSSEGLSAADELRNRVISGGMERFGELGDAVLERLEYELDIINSKNFNTYFLVVADIVARSPRTCGRGSGAASLVAYCLGITNVDPIAHNLYFERFLNRERTDPPDIDVDFAWDERDGVIDSVMASYGRSRCARVANHLHFQPRSAIREVGRVWGIPEGEISAWEHQAFGHHPVVRKDPAWDRIADIARRITGLPRGLSVHSGGVVMSPGPLSDHAPMEKAPSATIIAWEKEGTEATGLVKIDLLGNRSLAVIRDALANLAEQGIHVDPFEWNPLIDPATIALLARGDSMGVFYVESPAMRQLQKKTGAGDFEHLVIHSSIIRPAANRFINEYVRRLKGGAYQPLDPRLDQMLSETYGILCYQEDISKAAIVLAGFSEGDADQLRKVVSKKAGKRLLVFKDRFFEGARGKGIKEEVITAVWEMILSFDGYSFCKPHSASYAMVSFQSAWLKAHHPAEFIAGVLSNGGGFYTPGAYISEARRMGIGVDGPEVNHSRVRYHAENGRLRVGLMALRGLSAKVMETLVESRTSRGPFTGPEDFCRRLRPGRDDLEALVFSGALDCLATSGGVRRTGSDDFSAAKGVDPPFHSTDRPGLGSAASGDSLTLDRFLLFRHFLKLMTRLDAGRTYPLPADQPMGTAESQPDLWGQAPSALQPRGRVSASVHVSASATATLAPPVQAPAALHTNTAPPVFAPSPRQGDDAWPDGGFPPLPRLRSRELLWAEYRTLGFLVRFHPLVLWKDKLKTHSRIQGKDLHLHQGQSVRLIGWPICRKEIVTKTSELMEFFSFEDETAIYETVLFPKAFEDHAGKLLTQRPVWLFGTVEEDSGAVYLNVRSIQEVPD